MWTKVLWYLLLYGPNAQYIGMCLYQIHVPT